MHLENFVYLILYGMLLGFRVNIFNVKMAQFRLKYVIFAVQFWEISCWEIHNFKYGIYLHRFNQQWESFTTANENASDISDISIIHSVNYQMLSKLEIKSNMWQNMCISNLIYFLCLYFSYEINKYICICIFPFKHLSFWNDNILRNF